VFLGQQVQTFNHFVELLDLAQDCLWKAWCTAFLEPKERELQMG